MSGFHKLSNYFLIEERFVKQTFQSQAKIGSMYFQNNIKLGIYPEGIFVSLGFPFKLLLNKSLLIPWQEINVKENYEDNAFYIEMEWGPDKVKVIISDEKIINALYRISQPEVEFHKSERITIS
ncbi:MAG: hypothetical protein QNJ31_02525 [Candidatus Caenarcaniphilales bacterium]|nr:hypothetical protein [Candidatus Caenarcaniphilales bacterium]